jgi:hypothetical protein
MANVLRQTLGMITSLMGDRPKRQQSVRPGVFESDGLSVQLGSFRIYRVFTSFAIPLALYACQRLLLGRKVGALMSFEDFSAPPPQQVVQTDVEKHETVFANYLARLDGILVACLQKNEGLMVVAYSPSEEAAIKFFEDLDREISVSNIYRGKCLYFSGQGIEFKPTPPTQWDDLILERRLKDEILLNTANFLVSKELHKKGILKRGLILHGPPGTGKTTVVRAVFRLLEGTEVTRIYVTSEAFTHMGMDQFFQMVKHVLPAIVVFEDIDLIGPSRHIRRGGAIGTLLTHLDGVDKVTAPLVVMGTTNDFESVDEALTNRPARFDRVLEIPRPTAAEIRIFYRRLGGFDPDERLVSASEGFTGAHIEEVVKTSQMMAVQAGDGSDPSKFILEAVRTVRHSFGGGSQVGFRPKKPPGFPGTEMGLPEELLDPVEIMPAPSPFDDPMSPEASPDGKNFPEQRWKRRLAT